MSTDSSSTDQAMLLFIPTINFGDTRTTCYLKASSTSFALHGKSVSHMFSTCGEFGGVILERPVAGHHSAESAARRAAENAITVVSDSDGFELTGGIFVFESDEGAESHVPIRFFPNVASLLDLPSFQRNRQQLANASRKDLDAIDKAAQQIRVTADIILPVVFMSATNRRIDAFLDLQIPAGGAGVGYLHVFGEHSDVPKDGVVLQPSGSNGGDVTVGRFENLFVGGA